MSSSKRILERSQLKWTVLFSLGTTNSSSSGVRMISRNSIDTAHGHEMSLYHNRLPTPRHPHLRQWIFFMKREVSVLSSRHGGILVSVVNRKVEKFDRIMFRDEYGGGIQNYRHDSTMSTTLRARVFSIMTLLVRCKVGVKSKLCVGTGRPTLSSTLSSRFSQSLSDITTTTLLRRMN